MTRAQRATRSVATLARAQADMERAQARKRLARAELLPALSASLDAQQSLYSFRKGRVSDDPANEGITTGARGTLAQPLFDKAAWSGVRAAGQAEQAAQNVSLDARRRYLANLADAVLEVLSVVRLLDIARAGLTEARARLALARGSEELGRGTRLDVLRIEQDQSAALDEVLVARESVLRAREDLGLALGSSVPMGVADSLAFEDIEQAIFARCEVVPFEARPDVAAARYDVARADAVRAQAVDEFWPTLGLESTASARTSGRGGARTEDWSLALVLDLPLWDGGVRGGNVALADATLVEARALRTSVEDTVRVERAQADRALALARARFEAARAARTAAVQSDVLTREGFTSGVGTSLELIVSSAARRRAELNEVLRAAEVSQAKINAHLVEALCRF